MTINWNLWRFIGGMLALVFVVLAANAWLQERDARIKAESVQAAQQQVISAAQKQIDQAKADSASAATALQAKLADLEKQKQQPISAQDFAAALQKLVPLPQAPVVVQLPAQTQTANGKTESLPSAPVVQIPAADLPALRDYKLGCDETSAKLSACQLTDAADQQELAATKQQLHAAETERDAYKSASKGGSFLHRLKGDLKCLAISGGAAAAGAYAYKRSPAIGAVAGVAVGEVGCRLF